MIRCQDVIKIFTDQETNMRIPALRGIDLEIEKGEVISMIGPSGSGKSTLIKILAGMETISSGEIFVGEHQLDLMSSKQLLEYQLNTVGLVHQFPERTLFLSGTVNDNLSFAASLKSKNQKENRIRTREILERLGIEHLENRRVSFLSGGEMIRTAIACMLAKNSQLLLCDEPTGQLDTKNTEKVKELLRDISRDFGTTILVVTHDHRFLKGVDRTCEIQSGRVSALFTAEDNLSSNLSGFPLEFTRQIDSTQNVRIPSEVYKVLQLQKKVKFSINEDLTIQIKHPKNLPPKNIQFEEIRKHKKLIVKSLMDNYFNNSKITIQLENVSKFYGSRSALVKAVNNISLKIRDGELVFIIGPSGSGKTTLIKLLTGMESVSKGSINIMDYELHAMNDGLRAKFRREELGIVSQQGDLHPSFTVKNNLFIKDVIAGKNINMNRLSESDIESIFDTFQITHRQSSYPLEISGGELQRASLAVAKFSNPTMLILDEPTANMDAELANEVMNEIYKTHREHKMTILITTHDINLVRDETRVLELEDGKIKNDGLAYMIEE